MLSFLKQYAQRATGGPIVSPLYPSVFIAAMFFLNSCNTYFPLGPSNGLLSSSGNPNRHGSAAPERTAMRSPSLPLDLPIVFQDDLDRESLKKVIRNQLNAMQGVDESEGVQLEEMALTKGDLKDVLTAFLSLLNQNLSLDEFNRRLRKDFMFYKAGQGTNKKFLFTGYYTPIIQASPVKTEEYLYPIYNSPDDTNAPDDPVELSFVGHPGKSLPNWKDFTRRQIDHLGVLKDRNLEIAWLKDDLERFFLHIQGSGLLEFPDGKRQGVRYAGANNYGYQGIGKLMVKDGLLTGKGERSMQGIKNYLRNNPAEMAKYLYQNKRYIFFAYTDEGPRGSGGGELVGGRSIATDKSVYPAGGLALTLIRKPVLNETDEIIRWERSFRFVVDQDTGSDIRGPGRGDLFFGVGLRPGIMAGNFKEWGEVYYLIKRN